MFHIPTHKYVAMAIYAGMVTMQWKYHGKEWAFEIAIALGGILLLILFDWIVAELSSIGFLASFASDYKDGMSPESVSFLCWILFIIVCGLILFK